MSDTRIWLVYLHCTIGEQEVYEITTSDEDQPRHWGGDHLSYIVLGGHYFQAGMVLAITPKGNNPVPAAGGMKVEKVEVVS